MKKLFLILTLLSSSLSILAQGHDEKLPIKFFENNNQWDAQVKYRAEIPSGFLFLKQNSLQFSFYDAEAINKIHASKHSNSELGKQEEVPSKIKAHAYEIEFVKANQNPQIKTAGKYPANYNYFLGKDKSRWASNVETFNQITYQNLYDDIDLKLFASVSNVKYEFLVAANADASQIKLKYKHVNKISIKNGVLVIKTSINEVRELKPYSYQIIDGKKVEVASEFVLRGKELHFKFPNGYNKTLPLVIDPDIVFVTYSGSVSNNFGNSATFGENGTLYTAGIVFGQDFPLTSGAFDVTYEGAVDIGILKFDAQGKNLLYGAFLGGEDTETPHSMVMNIFNELVIMGSTSSLGFPTTASAFQTTFGGGNAVAPPSGQYSNGSDIFISKISANGSTLLASTLLGGNGNDGLGDVGDILVNNYGDEFRGDVFTDGSGNIYISSTTSSANFPIVGTASTVGGGNRDAVVVKMNSNLSAINWSRFVGGNGTETGNSIKVNAAGDVYICGGTSSNNFNPTIGTAIGGQTDAYVAKFNGNTGALIASRMVGTDNHDQAYFLDFDPDGNVYLLGSTYGTYPVSSGVYSNVEAGHFLHKLSGDLQTTLLTTSIGRENAVPALALTAFLVSDCGDIYLSGWGGVVNGGYNNSSTSSDLPITGDAYRSTTNGSNFYLMILGKNANDLIYGTYFGGDGGGGNGDHVDGGTSRFDKDGTVYHAVCACRRNSFPATPEAWSPIMNSPGGCNNAAFKFDLPPIKAAFDIVDDQGNIVSQACLPFEFKLKNRSEGGTSFLWEVETKGTTTVPDEPRYVFTQTGVYTLKLTAFDARTCQESDAVIQTIEIFDIEAQVEGDTLICKGETVPLLASGGTKYRWTPVTGLSNPNIANPTASPNQTTTYTVNVSDAVCDKDVQVTVEVRPDAVPDFEIQLIEECGELPQVKIINNSGGGANYEWDFGDGTTSTLENPPIFSYDTTGTFIVKLKVTNSACAKELEKSILIFVKPDVVPDVDFVATICPEEPVQLNASGGVKYIWTPAETLSDPTISNPIATPATTTTYTVSITNEFDCTRDTTITVNVFGDFEVDFEATPSPDCRNVNTIILTNTSLGAGNFIWDFGNGDTLHTENPVSYTYSEAGTYIISLSAGNENCQKTVFDTLEIFINDFNVVQNKDTVCIGDTVQLNAAGGVSYLWIPSTGLNNDTIQNPVAQPLVDTDYNVQITSQQGCVFDTTIRIEVLEDVLLDFEANVSDTCTDVNTVFLSNKSTGLQNFVWDFGNGDTLHSTNPVSYTYNQAGTYVITLFASNNFCDRVATDTVQIFINNFGIGNLADSICAGDTTQLFASGGISYQWTPTTGLSDANIANPLAFPTQTTNYAVKITSEQGCSFDTTVLIKVFPKITADFEVIVTQECDNFALITIINKSVGVEKIHWDFGNGLTSDELNPPPFRYTEEGDYTITLETDNSICTKIETASLDVRFEPLNKFLENAAVIPEREMCFADTIVLFATGGVKYEWTPTTGLSDPTISNPVATPNETTIYTVRISNVNECFVEKTVEVKVEPEIVLDFDINITNECGKSAVVEFVNRTTGARSFNWVLDNGDSLNISNPDNYVYDESGKYSITLEATNDFCGKTRTVEVKVDNLYLPNVITPNGDGKNDFFDVGHASEGWVLIIADRWGKEVFRSDSYQNDWGEISNNATYYYRVISPNGLECKGWLQVIR